jgi:hypothetical protein
MEVLDYLKRIGKKGGEIGGKVTARRMSKAERIARARKAGIASGKARGEKALRRKG